MSIFCRTPGTTHHADRLGGATLAADGLFAKLPAMPPSAFRHLSLNLLLSLGGLPSALLDKRRMPRIQGIDFEVRPDLPCCLIGEGIWEMIRRNYSTGVMNFPLGGPRTLPPYGVLISTGLRKTSWHGMMLSFHHGAFEAPVTLDPAHRFDWGKTIPLVYFGVSKQLNPQMCCLGYEFLSHGILCWQAGRTYFFPAQTDQEIWADFKTSRQFKVENPTPLSATGSNTSIKLLGP